MTHVGMSDIFTYLIICVKYIRIFTHIYVYVCNHRNMKGLPALVSVCLPAPYIRICTLFHTCVFCMQDGKGMARKRSIGSSSAASQAVS
mmetsp:Transcript_97265/g.156870  ORF Transcript_97265/g.156870 Transcript_97265/m.156870 type:complete len:89 (-) Transcript_97265:501-767(-)